MANIGIVGLGLIGGSLGLDLRALGHQVLGISRHPETCQRAIERGAELSIAEVEPALALLEDRAETLDALAELLAPGPVDPLAMILPGG